MTDPCDDEMAQNAVPDYSKANSVVYVAEDNLWRVLERPLDARNGISRFLERLSALVKVKCHLTGIFVYPLTRFDLKAHNLVGGRRYSNCLKLLELATALVCDNHAHSAATVLFLAYKHAIKVLILGLRHPRHHEDFLERLILKMLQSLKYQAVKVRKNNTYYFTTITKVYTSLHSPSEDIVICLGIPFLKSIILQSPKLVYPKLSVTTSLMYNLHPFTLA